MEREGLLVYIYIYKLYIILCRVASPLGDGASGAVVPSPPLGARQTHIGLYALI